MTHPVTAPEGRTRHQTMGRLRICASAIAVTLCALPAFAQDRALLVGNEAQARGATMRGAAAVPDAAGALEAAGFRVISAVDADAAGLRDALARFHDGSDRADRLVIVLAGHFARSDAPAGTAPQTWFLGTDANAPGLAGVGAAGLSLATLLEIAAQAPGGAVVALGTDERRLSPGPGLSAGLAAPATVPQGVTLVTGPVNAIARFAARDLPQRDRSLAGLLSAQPDLDAAGFVSHLAPFLPAAEPSARPDPADADRTLWETVHDLDSVEGYESYLDRFPGGRFAADARAALDDLAEAPTRAAQAAEDRLDLTRDERRDLQGYLNNLGYDTRGIDGIFGPGTRTAITRWQQRNGFDPTGFLNREARARLVAQGEQRAAEIAEEEQRRQAERDRDDRRFWEETGAGDDPGGLRAYLRQYPDGLFAERARARLDEIAASDRTATERQDREAWTAAQQTDRVGAYRGYLDAWPDGLFAADARDRIAEIQRRNADSAAIERAADAESALNLPQLTRQLIELRLQGLGLDPGGAEGTFDDNTRRALRQYQSARDLPATGYVDRQTMMQLLADTLPVPR